MDGCIVTQSKGGLLQSDPLWHMGTEAFPNEPVVCAQHRKPLASTMGVLTMLDPYEKRTGWYHQRRLPSLRNLVGTVQGREGKAIVRPGSPSKEGLSDKVHASSRQFDRVSVLDGTTEACKTFCRLRLFTLDAVSGMDGIDGRVCLFSARLASSETFVFKTNGASVSLRRWFSFEMVRGEADSPPFHGRTVRSWFLFRPLTA